MTSNGGLFGRLFYWALCAADEGGLTITSSIRKHAMRLALYIQSIGTEPNVTGRSYREYVGNLTRQYQQLEPAQRQEAKRKGRQMVRQFGLEKAIGHLVPAPPERMLKRAHRIRLDNMQHWPKETPPCPYCKIRRYKLPKKSWPSRESAEQVLAKQNDPLLTVYPCPMQPGYWHLGHTKRPKH